MAGGRFGVALLVGPVLGCRGDVELVQTGTAEGAAGALRGRNREHRVQAAVGRVSVDAAHLRRSPPRGPRRRRRSSRPGAPTPSGTVTRTRWSARVPRVPSNANAWMTRGPLSIRYMVRAVGTPADAVGDRQSLEHHLGPPVGIQPVERAAPLAVVVGQCPGPEPALGIAGAVVHPGSGRCDLGDAAMGAVERPGRRSHARRRAASRRRPRRGRSSRPFRAAGRPGPVQRTVVADPVAVDPPGHDVDGEQLAATGVPANALTELGLLGRARRTPPGFRSPAPIVSLRSPRRP